MSTAVLEVRELARRYGRHTVFEDVWLSVEPGEGLVVTGPQRRRQVLAVLGLVGVPPLLVAALALLVVGWALLVVGWALLVVGWALGRPPS